jgi:hypothetical protein
MTEAFHDIAALEFRPIRILAFALSGKGNP